MDKFAFDKENIFVEKFWVFQNNFSTYNLKTATKPINISNTRSVIVLSPKQC